MTGGTPRPMERERTNPRPQSTRSSGGSFGGDLSGVKERGVNKNPNSNPTPNQAQELQQAQELRRRQIEAAVAQARQHLVSTNADHARFMGMNVNANPALARKRDEKVREILAKRAKIESVIEQLLEKLPPGERGA